MSEEKDLLEMTEEVAEEVTEEAVEAEEVAEEVIEEAVLEAEEVFEEVAEEEAEEVEEEAEETEEKKKTSVLKAVIITLVVCVALMIAEYYVINARLNHYNLNEDGYATTIGQSAEQIGMTVEEFIAENGLPEDMPADTVVSIAQNYLTLGKMLELNGMTSDMLPVFAQMYGIDESLVSEDMYMGEFNKLAYEVQKAQAEAEPEEAPAPKSEEAVAPEGEEAAPEVEAAE